MKIHVLTDNRTQKRGMLAEHGLSVYIETDEANVLFDTGQTDVYLRNAALMGLALKPDCIVLSHGHYDHGGGLIFYPPQHMPKIYLHPDTLRVKFAAKPDGYRENGLPWALRNHPAIRDNMIYNDRDMPVAPGVSLHARIPAGAFEDATEGLFAEIGGVKQPDLMLEEQMLIFDRKDGLAIFLGCSHSGIINCLLHARALYPNRKIDTVLAGMHLTDAVPQHIEQTTQKLYSMDIARLIPLHCTGLAAIAVIKQIFGDRCLPLCAGDSLEI